MVAFTVSPATPQSMIEQLLTWASPMLGARMRINQLHVPPSGAIWPVEEAGRDTDNHRRIFGVSMRHIPGPREGAKRAWDLEIDMWAGLWEATADEPGVGISVMTSSLPWTPSCDLSHQEPLPVPSRLYS